MTAFFQAAFLLSGTVIGAGMFSLPYSFLLSGFWVSLFGLVVLTLLTLALNLFYARLILKNSGDHQLCGYMGKYFGQKGKSLGSIAILLSAIGALLAYVILGGNFLSLFLGTVPSLFYRLIFLLVGIIFFVGGIKTISSFGGILSLGLVVLAIVFSGLGIKYFQLQNLFIPATDNLAFYGPVLFSLSGAIVIPEVEEVLRINNKRNKLYKAIILGTLLPAIVYIVFSFGVLAISGAFTTADALSGLIVWSPLLVRVGAIVGFFSCLTSFYSLANVLKELCYRDFRISRKLSVNLPILIGLIGVWLSVGLFFKIISLTGTFAIGLIGILIAAMYLKAGAKAWEKAISWVIMAVFALGMILQLAY